MDLHLKLQCLIVGTVQLCFSCYASSAYEIKIKKNPAEMIEMQLTSGQYLDHQGLCTH